MLHGCFTDVQVLAFENELITMSENTPKWQMACSSRIAFLVKDTANLLPSDAGNCAMGGVKNGQKDGHEEEQDCETVHVERSVQRIQTRCVNFVECDPRRETFRGWVPLYSYSFNKTTRLYGCNLSSQRK